MRSAGQRSPEPAALAAGGAGRFVSRESERTMATTVYELYQDLWGQGRPGFDERIATSLSPRDPDSLDEMFFNLGVGQKHIILDIGCRDALHSVEFVQRCGCRAVAIDPIPRHMEWARQRVAEAGLEDRITLLLGQMERLPLEDASIDYVWCRDVLSLVSTEQGLAECFRVLRCAGVLLTYQAFATELLEPKESARLYEAMAIIPQSMVRGRFEQVARAAGFVIVAADTIGSEWRENALENGWGSLDASLLRLSRMRRLEFELVHEYGRLFYEAAYAGTLWNVYQVLGKLCPVAYVLKKP
jgi:cyclopropane fatty-acyl-phospholipid synthase-like methyltransferase